MTKKDGEVVSATVVLTYRRKIFYLFGGINKLGFDANAPAYLFWHFIGSCIARGDDKSNFGSVPGCAVHTDSDGQGLYRFTGGFSRDIRQRPHRKLDL